MFILVKLKNPATIESLINETIVFKLSLVFSELNLLGHWLLDGHDEDIR